MLQSSPRLRTRHPALTLLAIGVAGLCSAGGAHANSTAPAAAGAPDAMVTIHTQHYRWTGQTFDSLDALAAMVLPRTPRSVGLLACGPQATPALLAAAHRFRHLELHLSVGAAGAARCQEQTQIRPTPVALREDAKPLHFDDAAVRAWWQQSMP